MHMLLALRAVGVALAITGGTVMFACDDDAGDEAGDIPDAIEDVGDELDDPFTEETETPDPLEELTPEPTV